MPNCFEIAAQERPCARRAAILSASAITRGLPRRLPLARAEAMPERTRSRINSRSNSAMLAKMPNINRPFGGRGHYDTVVFEAFRVVEVAVRDSCGFPPTMLGTDLMRKAFAT